MRISLGFALRLLRGWSWMDHAALPRKVGRDVFPAVGETGDCFGGDWFFLCRVLLHARLWCLSPP